MACRLSTISRSVDLASWSVKGSNFEPSASEKAMLFAFRCRRQVSAAFSHDTIRTRTGRTVPIKRECGDAISDNVHDWTSPLVVVYITPAGDEIANHFPVRNDNVLLSHYAELNDWTTRLAPFAKRWREIWIFLEVKNIPKDGQTWWSG